MHVSEKVTNFKWANNIFVYGLELVASAEKVSDFIEHVSVWFWLLTHYWMTLPICDMEGHKYLSVISFSDTLDAWEKKVILFFIWVCRLTLNCFVKPSNQSQLAVLWLGHSTHFLNLHLRIVIFLRSHLLVQCYFF